VLCDVLKEYGAFIFMDYLSFAGEGTVFFQNTWKEPSDMASHWTSRLNKVTVEISNLARLGLT
jgi:hypothetical protein